MVSAEPGYKTISTSDLVTTSTLAPDIQAQVDYYNNISYALRLYVTPFIIFGGTVGNILTIIVVLSRHFRYSPSSVLLLALAVVDIGVLYFNLLDIWLSALLGGNSLQFTRDQGDVGCKISTFMTYFLTHSSSWILVLINIDRVISVYQPLKARTWCTKKRLGIALLIMFVLLALISLHVFWSLTFMDELENYKCQFDVSVFGEHGEPAWLFVDAAIFTFVPFIIILSCNVAIILALLRAARRRNAEMNVRNSASNDSTTSITTMLITISIVFLLTTSPLTICYQFYGPIVEKYADDPVGYALYFELLVNTVLVLLCYNNNAVNFLLYCISGSKFRRALADMCGRGKRRSAMSEPFTSHTSMMSRTTVNQPATKFNLTDMRTSHLKGGSSPKTNGRMAREESWKTTLYEVGEDPAPKQGYVNSQCID